MQLDQIGRHHGGAAGAPRLAVHVDAVTALAVLQDELDAPVQVVQRGDSGQIHGAEAQLLYSQRLPLLRGAAEEAGLVLLVQSEDGAHVLLGHQPTAAAPQRQRSQQHGAVDAVEPRPAGGGQLRPQRRVQQRRVEKQPRCPGAQSRRHPHRGRAGAPLGSARGRAAVALRSARSGRPAGEGSGPAPASPCLAPGVVSPGSAAILRSRPEAAQGAERLRVYLRGQVGAAAARRSSGRAGQERRGVRGERDPPRAE